MSSSDSDDALPAPRTCGERVGNTVTVYTSRASPSFPFTCVIGPDWPCNTASWALIFGISLAFLVLIAPRLHVAVLAANATTLAVLAAAFAVTSLSDPGYLPRQTPEQLAADRAALGAAPPPAAADAAVVSGMPGAGGAAVDAAAAAGFTACSVCHVLRARGTMHCYDCARCVRDLDHHCPWSGKCIGGGNMAPFKFSLITLLIHAVFTSIAFVIWAISFR